MGQGFLNEGAPLIGGGGNERTKVWMALITLMGVSFLMALDFMIVFLTVQGYWESVGGKYAWYGVVFSSYTIAQCVFIPILSELLDRQIIQATLAITVVVNLIGNVIYMAGASNGLDYHSAQALIIIGRVIAGAGAANIVVGPYYIVSHTDNVNERTNRIAQFNLAGFVGRVVGPVLAFTILSEEPTKDLGNFVLNQFTWPPLITTVVGIPVLIAVIILFPRRASGDTYQAEEMQGGQEFKKDMSVFLILHTLLTLLFWAYYANVITIAATQYGFAYEYDSNLFWRAYLPMLVGFVAATSAMKHLIEDIKAPSILLLLASPIMMAIGYFILLDYGQQGQYSTMGEARFWIGSIFLAAGFNFENATVYSLFSEMADASNNSVLMGRLLGILTLFTAVGRAIGPLWTPPMLHITYNTKYGGSEECCSYKWNVYDPFDNNTCCELQGINAVVVILGIGMGAIAVAMIFLLRPILTKYSERYAAIPK